MIDCVQCDGLRWYRKLLASGFVLGIVAIDDQPPYYREYRLIQMRPLSAPVEAYRTSIRNQWENVQ
ncbi:hypothetical protein KKH18_06885 [bacterium]|nr:hypothetical protein [bacterium]